MTGNTEVNFNCTVFLLLPFSVSRNLCAVSKGWWHRWRHWLNGPKAKFTGFIRPEDFVHSIWVDHFNGVRPLMIHAYRWFVTYQIYLNRFCLSWNWPSASKKKMRSSTFRWQWISTNTQFIQIKVVTNKVLYWLQHRSNVRFLGFLFCLWVMFKQ